MIYRTETEETWEHLCAVKGKDLAFALNTILEELRSRIKYRYTEDKIARKLCEEIRDMIHAELEGYNIDLEDLLTCD